MSFVGRVFPLRLESRPIQTLRSVEIAVESLFGARTKPISSVVVKKTVSISFTTRRMTKCHQARGKSIIETFPQEDWIGIVADTTSIIIHLT